MKILIIGLGSIGRRHARVLQEMDSDVEIDALRSSESVVEIPGIKNLDAFPLDHKYDFVIISNPTSLHFEAIKKCIGFGCPLFIEKPSVHTLEDAGLLSDLIRNKGIMTYVACNLRFHPALTFLREHLNENQYRINEINAYCGSYLPGWRPDQDFRDSYSVNPDLGGGVHMDLIHEIDYVFWLFGSPLGSQSYLFSNSSLEIEAIDYANYVLKYDKFCASIILNYYRVEPKRTLEIVTSEGTLSIDLLNNSVYLKGEQLFKGEVDWSDKTYMDQMNYFIRSLRDEEQPMNSFDESLNVLRICLGNV